MKPGIYILSMMMGCLLLWGCPYSSSYKLDDTPAIYTEDILKGNWATIIKKNAEGKEEAIKMILSQKSDTEYIISFTGAVHYLKPFRVVQNDTITGTAFMSTVLGYQFLNITIKSRIYIAELKFENQKLSLLPLAENFTSKIVLSNASLRSCVEFHYKTRRQPLYDEEFCLKDMVKVN